MNLWGHRFTQNPNQKLQSLFALPSNKLPGKKSLYSRLSNKHDVTLTDFGKFHPAQNKNSPCTFIDFITKLSIWIHPGFNWPLEYNSAYFLIFHTACSIVLLLSFINWREKQGPFWLRQKKSLATTIVRLVCILLFCTLAIWNMLSM